MLPAGQSKCLKVVRVLRLLRLGFLLGLVAAAGWGGFRLHEEMDAKGCRNLAGLPTKIQHSPQSPDRVRVAALGDTGTGDTDQKQVAHALAKVCRSFGCDFVLLLGDNFYPDGLSGLDDPQFDEKFTSLYQDLGIPVYGVLGNHDVRQHPLPQVLAGVRGSQWRMPNYQYILDAEFVRFHALNTNCGPLALNALAEGLTPTQAPAWTVALGHHPVYSSGTHGDADPLTQLFWEWQFGDVVDVHLSGHDHHLAHLRTGSRTEFVVSGAGGKHYRNEDERKRLTPSAGELLFQHLDTGFVWLEFTPTRLEGRFHDSTGALLYRFERERSR